MKTIQAFVERHPLLSYLAFVFVISWGGVLIAIGPGDFPPNGERFFRMIAFGYIAMLAGPSIAGLLLTGLIFRRAGLGDLASRLSRWRMDAQWYAVALLTAPLAILAVLLALSLIRPEFLPRLFVEQDKIGLFQYSIIAGLLTGIFEELGWTGFAVPLLLKRGYGVLRTGLIVGFLVGAWDLIVVSGDLARTTGTLPAAILLPAVLFTWMPAYRVLMVWVYNRTGSLLVAMLMQSSLIAFWTNLTPMVLAGINLVTYYLVLTAVFAAITAAFAATSRREQQLPKSLVKRAA